MNPAKKERPALVIVEFCRFARASGLSVGVQQTLAALEIAKAVPAADRPEFAYGLRAALCSSKEEWDLFDKIFAEFRDAPGSETENVANQENQARFRSSRPEASSRALTELAGESSTQEREGKAVSGASMQQRLQKVDLSEVPLEDVEALEQISMRLFRKMSRRLSRKRKIKKQGEHVDVRRTIRSSIARGGDPIVLAFQGKKPRKHRLVIFLDISGSMNSYSLFLVRFAYALQKYFRKVNTFLFSTEVVEITDVLGTRDLPEALQGLSQRAAGWAGGTKIGESLREFNRRHGGKLLSRDTVFIILSDGWDTGEPEILAAELRRARRRVQKLVWLNPLLGLSEYEPVTRGMSAALPNVDVFAAAHNLESLAALERHL